MIKTGLWLRVSTDDQTTENQRGALVKEAARLDFYIAQEWDLSASATRGNATDKALGEVMRAGRGRHIQHLIVWSLDRLSRSGIAATFSMMERLEIAGVKVHSVQESWLTDTEGPLRDLYLAIVAFIAEFESKRLSERTKAGIERRRAEGKPIGRPRKG